ncbi:hypothetical protein Syun_029958 [Stephania yunnanensis]|uniref:Uncharacterized protein n=1 Tax=Stephania yunnanensis TaxID=152371 RepID=A0AAP0EEV8_9MAGN
MGRGRCDGNRGAKTTTTTYDVQMPSLTQNQLNDYWRLKDYVTGYTFCPSLHFDSLFNLHSHPSTTLLATGECPLRHPRPPFTSSLCHSLAPASPPLPPLTNSSHSALFRRPRLRLQPTRLYPIVFTGKTFPASNASSLASSSASASCPSSPPALPHQRFSSVPTDLEPLRLFFQEFLCVDFDMLVFPNTLVERVHGQRPVGFILLQLASLLPLDLYGDSVARNMFHILLAFQVNKGNFLASTEHKEIDFNKVLDISKTVK